MAHFVDLTQQAVHSVQYMQFMVCCYLDTCQLSHVVTSF